MRAMMMALVVFGACGDEGKRGIGSTCENDQECESGFCVEQQCFDPQTDSDGDGLVNTIERGLGTSVKLADTDGDGISDADELGDGGVSDPMDTDGDGLIDARESSVDDADEDCVVDQLDPANDDSEVPGNQCGNNGGETVRVSDPVRDAYIGDVATLADGGFVVSWSEGRTPGVTGDAGRMVAFFDPNGNEKKRLVGLDLDETATQRYFPTSMLGLHDGNAVLLSWRYIDARFVMSTQRFSADGEALGEPIQIYTGTDPSRFDKLVAYGGGAYGVAYVEPEKPVLTLRYVNERDALAQTFGGRPLRDSVDIDVLGMRNGETVAVSREMPATGGAEALLLKVFDATGEQTTADVVVQTKPTRTARLAPIGDELGVFWIEGETEGPFSVLWQTFDASLAPSSDMAALTSNDRDGCPNRLVAGFDRSGSPFAAVSDEPCASPLRGWYGKGDILPLAIAPNVADEQLVGVRGAGGSEPVFYYVRSPLNGDPATGWVTRIGPDGKPSKVTLQ